jgi:hypothetical protein
MNKIISKSQLADALISTLELFPVTPRGKLKSLEWASEEARKIIDASISEEIGMAKAISALKEVARESAYEEPPTTISRRKAQIGQPIITDATEDLPIYISIKQEGRGNRSNVRRLSEFVRCFLDFKKIGLTLPEKGIEPEHLQNEAFVDAIKNAGFLTRSDLTIGDLSNASKGDRGRLYRAAKHTISQAAKIVNQKS